MCDSASDLCMTYNTWQSRMYGAHNEDAGYVRSIVAELMDQFLDEYFRVNEAACANG